MDLERAMFVSSNGMKAQGTRMRVISENIANAGVVSNLPDEDPYRRQVVTFKTEMDRQNDVAVVQVNNIDEVKGEFPLRYEPNHPGADENGYIRTPNVNSLIESMDMREAQRSYEANIGMLEMSRSMMMKTVDLLRN